MLCAVSICSPHVCYLPSFLEPPSPSTSPCGLSRSRVVYRLPCKFLPRGSHYHASWYPLLGAWQFCRTVAFSSVWESGSYGMPETRFLGFAPKIELCDRAGHGTMIL